MILIVATYQAQHRDQLDLMQGAMRVTRAVETTRNVLAEDDNLASGLTTAVRATPPGHLLTHVEVKHNTIIEDPEKNL